MSHRERAQVWVRARRILRDVVSYGLVVLIVAGVGLFAWMTRRPDAAFFERCATLPVLGPAVERWRAPWLLEQARRRSELAQRERSERARRDGELALVEPPHGGERIFLGGGVSLREAPRSDARELLRSQVIRRVSVLERRESWVRVRMGTGSAQAPAAPWVEGWVDLEAPRRQEPPLGNAPLPPRPVDGRGPDPQRLALARSLLGDEDPTTRKAEPRTARLGPYIAYHDLPSDAESRALLERLDRAAESAERLYRRRYGLDTVGSPAAAIVLFAERDDYDRFQDESAELRGLVSRGHVAEGLVALWVGITPPPEVELTLLHEITHLLGRRALGPALPPWLGEGLAEEFSELGYALENGTTRAQRLAEFRTSFGDTYQLTGPLASLDLLLDAGGSGRVPSLARLTSEEWREFVHDPDVGLRYGASGWFLHWLLEGPREHGAALRRFLAAVAAGEEASGERLRSELGAEWSTLDLEFRAWLAAEAVRAGV